MADLVKPLVKRVKALQKTVAALPRFGWAAVTQASPLRVQLDGAASELSITPDVVGTVPDVGARVLTMRTGTRLTVLNFGAGGGGGGTGLVRATVVKVGASGSTTVDMGKDAFSLVSLQSSAATRVRAYRSSTDRSADAARPVGKRPAVQGEVLFEFIFESPATYYATGFWCFLPALSTTVYLTVDGATDLTFEIER